MESPTTKSNVTDAQYLAEFVNIRKSKKTKVPIGPKYWLTPEWSSEYKLQIRLAHSLLKSFSLEVLLLALNTKELNWMYSLGHKLIIDIAKREQHKLETHRNAMIQPVSSPSGMPDEPEVQEYTQVAKPVIKKNKAYIIRNL